MTQILDGKTLAKTIQTTLAEKITAWAPLAGRPPGLAVVMVGDNPASAAYVRNKERACERVGIASFGQHLSADTTPAHVAGLLADFNADDRIDGILLQLPVPNH